MNIVNEYRLNKNEIIDLLGYSPNIIFDIGANIGDDSENYKELFPESQIYSFEPDTDAYDTLKLKKEINSFRLALSDENITKTLTARLYTNSTKGGTGSSCLDSIEFTQKGMLSNKSIKYTVECRRLDSIVEELNLSAIDFAHIDVEGHVLPMLEGFGKVRPRLILLEVVHPNSDRNSIKSKMIDMGYKPVKYVYPNEVFLYEK